MFSLFSYIIPIDDGAAPNPFWGMCTLAICKPRIREKATVGDWIAGLGSTKAPSGDLSGRLVYAMRVEEAISLRDYDARARAGGIPRIPNINSNSLQDRLGDCIYDFSAGEPVQRPSVHGPANMATDLSGKNALISSDFYYFGRNAIMLPEDLRPIVHQGQGHRRPSNEPYVDRFVSWIRNSGFDNGQVHGPPDFTVDWETTQYCNACIARKEDGASDKSF